MQTKLALTIVAGLLLVLQCSAWRRLDVFGDHAMCPSAKGMSDVHDEAAGTYTKEEADRRLAAMTESGREALARNHLQKYITTLGTIGSKQLFRVRALETTPKKKVDSVIYAVKAFAKKTGLRIHDFTITLQNARGELKPTRNGEIQKTGGVQQQFWPPSYISLSDAFPSNSIEKANLARESEKIPGQYDPQVVIAAVHELCHFAHWKNDAIKFAAANDCRPHMDALVSGYSFSNIAEWVAEVCTAKYFGWAMDSVPDFKDSLKVDVDELYTQFGGFDVSRTAVQQDQSSQSSQQPLESDQQPKTPRTQRTKTQSK